METLFFVVYTYHLMVFRAVLQGLALELHLENFENSLKI